MNKKISVTALMAACALYAAAGRPASVDIEAGAFHPVLSPDASTLLYSTIDHTGLKALDLASGKVSVIDADASAGFKPVFSVDGRRVYYRTASMVDGLLYRDIRAYDFAQNRSRQLAPPSRSSLNLAAVSGSSYACADFSSIEVFTDGRLTSISPIADAHTYQWASMSPDSRHIAFTEPFSGVYVCAPDGSDPVRILDKGDYVSWAGPATVIAVVSHDDGYVILDSRLVMVNINTGISTFITPDDVMVSEATASAHGKVVYSDLDGNMFILDINDR